MVGLLPGTEAPLRGFIAASLSEGPAFSQIREASKNEKKKASFCNSYISYGFSLNSPHRSSVGPYMCIFLVSLGPCGKENNDLPKMSVS